MFQGTRLAAAEAIHSGITFVHDWCHNIRSPEHARENLRALRESGIRGRFSYGTPQAASAPQPPVDLAELERLHGDWARYASDGLLSLGLAWRGGTSDVARKEFDAARGLGIPISAHAGLGAAGGILALAKANLRERGYVRNHEGDSERGKRPGLERVQAAGAARAGAGHHRGRAADPAYLIVDAAQPANVDTVVVDGRILKRNRKLTAIDADQVASEAAAAFADVRKRANW